MKLLKTPLYIAACLLVTVNCSKIEHAMETAEDIRSSTESLEHESSAALMKQKESGAIAAMGISVEKLKQSKTSTGRLAHATRYFAAMPFQFVERDEVRKHYHYKISLADFLAERFAELSEGRTEYSEIRVKKADGTTGIKEVVGKAKYTDITADYNPAHFPELAALAVRMHYISDDQKEMTEHPKSFMELLKEVLDASAYAETCDDCKLDNFKPYVQANMQFSGELINFLQLAHNTLSIAGLKGVIRPASNAEVSAQLWHIIKNDYLKPYTFGFIGADTEPAITQSSLIKDDTNIKDIQLSQERLDRAALIRQWLTDAGIKPVYSKYVFKEKFGKYLEQVEGVMSRSSLKSSEKQKAFNDYLNNIRKEYKNYEDSL